MIYNVRRHFWYKGVSMPGARQLFSFVCLGQGNS